MVFGLRQAAVCQCVERVERRVFDACDARRVPFNWLKGETIFSLSVLIFILCSCLFCTS